MFAELYGIALQLAALVNALKSDAEQLLSRGPSKTSFLNEGETLGQQSAGSVSAVSAEFFPPDFFPATLEEFFLCCNKVKALSSGSMNHVGVGKEGGVGGGRETGEGGRRRGRGGGGERGGGGVGEVGRWGGGGSW